MSTQSFERQEWPARAVVTAGMPYGNKPLHFGHIAGVFVPAAGPDGEGNSQLKCYALGALDTFGDLYNIRKIRLSIYQPRRQNISNYDMTVEELLKWADNITQKAITA